MENSSIPAPVITGGIERGARSFSPTPEYTGREQHLTFLGSREPEARNWLNSLSESLLKVLTPEIVHRNREVWKISSTPSPSLLSGQVFATPTSPSNFIPAPADGSKPSGPVPYHGTQGLGNLSNEPTPGARIPEDLEARLQLLENQENSTPTHHIQPPTPRGNMCLTPQEELKLGSLQRNTKFGSSLETGLRFAAKFVDQHPHVSEVSIMENLGLVLPRGGPLRDYEMLSAQSMTTLDVIYNYLQTHHGNSRSKAEVFTSLERLTSGATEHEPLEVLEKISRLLLTVTDSNKEFEVVIMQNSLRYLKQLMGPDLFVTLQMALGEGGFHQLYRLCKVNFHDSLLKKFQEKKSEVKKIRKINVNPISVDPEMEESKQGMAALPVPTPTSSLLVAPATDPDYVLRQLLASKNRESVLCYNCNHYGHFARDCGNPKASAAPNPQERLQPSVPMPLSPPGPPAARNIFTDRLCQVHPRGKHTNGMCFALKELPCVLHNGAHAMADCRSYETPILPDLAGNPNNRNRFKKKSSYQQPSPGQPPQQYQQQQQGLQRPQQAAQQQNWGPPQQLQAQQRQQPQQQPPIQAINWNNQQGAVRQIQDGSLLEDLREQINNMAVLIQNLIP